MPNVADFEAFCRRGRVIPIGKVETRHGEVLLGERFIESGPEFDGPYWSTLWWVLRDEFDCGRFVHHPAYVSQVGSIALPVPAPIERKDRVKGAVDDAMEWIEANVGEGRY